MKINDFLMEDANPGVLKYLNTNPEFVRVGKQYIFVWTDETLEELLNVINKHSRIGGDIVNAELPNSESVGIGVVDPETSAVAVGYLDPDAVDRVQVIGSTPLQPFFKSIGDKLTKMFFDLETLGRLYKEMPEVEDDTFGGSGAERIKNFMINDEEDFYAWNEERVNKFMEKFVGHAATGEEAKNKLEDAEKHLEARLKIVQTRLKSVSAKFEKLLTSGNLTPEQENKIYDIYHKENADDLKEKSYCQDQLDPIYMLLGNPEVFKDEEEPNNPEDAEAEASYDIEKQMDDWFEKFQADYPGLKVYSPTEFLPKVF